MSMSSTKLTCIVCGGVLVVPCAPLIPLPVDLAGNPQTPLVCQSCQSKHTLTNYQEEKPYLSLNSTNTGRK